MSKNEKQRNARKSHKINIRKKNSIKQNRETTHDNRLLKDRFLEAVVKGELGSVEEAGAVVLLKEFKAYFSDITTQYASSFMPAATFDPGRFRPSHTKFLFRLRKGAYLIHSDVFVAYMRQMLEEGRLIDGNTDNMSDRHQCDDDPSVKEVALCYCAVLS